MKRSTDTEIKLVYRPEDEGRHRPEVERLKSLWLDQTPLSDSDKARYGIAAAVAFIIGCAEELEPGLVTVRYAVVTSDVAPLDIHERRRYSR